MAGQIVRQAALHRTVFNSNGQTVFNDVNANAGTTLPSIVTRTGLVTPRVRRMVEILENSQRILSRPDLSGLVKYWALGDWQTAIGTNIAAARIWIDDTAANDGEDQGQMAADLGVEEAVAVALSLALAHEGAAILE